LLDLVDEKTSFVSVTHVNNETGAINDVNLIAKLVKQKNNKIIFHTDGVQSFLKIPYRLSNEIDMYSFSAHKICALKGVGGLVYKKTLSVKPLLFGGGQEKNFRSGTENTFGICVLGEVIKKYSNVEQNLENVKKLNNLFKDSLRDDVVFVSSENASPYIISFSIPGVKAEIMQRVLDDNGLLVGTGSACSSKLGISRIIASCGLDKKVADGVLRVSFIYTTTENEVLTAVDLIKRCAQKLRVVLK
jgi:cysteine desulfurase